MGRRTREQTEKLREDIVDEALIQFSENGFEATSIRAIAKEVGLSKQALMHHFPTKQSLQDAILDRVKSATDSMLPQMVGVLLAQDAELDDLLAQLQVFTEQHTHLVSYLLRMLAFEREMPVPSSGQAISALLLDFMRRGQESGQLRADFHPEDTLFTLGMMFLGCHTAMRRHKDSWGLSEAEFRRRGLEMLRVSRLALLP